MGKIYKEYVPSSSKIIQWLLLSLYTNIISTTISLKLCLLSKRIEYILEGNLLEKSLKRPFCCTVSIMQVILHIFMLYNILGPGISFYRKSKINIKRKPNYEIGWFHDWPMIISHRLYAFHSTNDDFPL